MSSILDYMNKVDDLETKLYIVAGVLGGVCGLLTIAVIILSIAAAKVNSRCEDLKRKQMQMQSETQNNNNSQMRIPLQRQRSIVNEKSYPNSQGKPYQLTAENLMNMELKNQLHNRNRDSDWDNDVRSAPGGKRNSTFYNQRGGIHSDSGDRPFPLSQRPGNPGNFSSNMQNVGY